MKGKKLLTGFLLVFVVASIGYLLVKESRRGSLAGSSPSGEAVATSEGSVPVPERRADNPIGPALVGLGFDPKKASATTAFLVIFSSLSGFLGKASIGGMDGRLLAWKLAGG